MPTTVISLENKAILADIIELADMVIKHFHDAKDSIESSDNDLALKVIDDEMHIFNSYIRIESDLAFAITKAPVDKNLRRVLAYLSIARNFSRLGGYANEMAKFRVKLGIKPAKSSIRRIDSVQELVVKQIHNVKKVVQQEDAKEALVIAGYDKKIDELVDTVRKEIMSSVSRKSEIDAISERMFVFNIVNSLERAGDHIKRICEIIAYIQTGEHIRV